MYFFVLLLLFMCKTGTASDASQHGFHSVDDPIFAPPKSSPLTASTPDCADEDTADKPSEPAATAQSTEQSIHQSAATSAAHSLQPPHRPSTTKEKETVKTEQKSDDIAAKPSESAATAQSTAHTVHQSTETSAAHGLPPAHLPIQYTRTINSHLTVIDKQTAETQNTVAALLRIVETQSNALISLRTSFQMQFDIVRASLEALDKKMDSILREQRRTNELQAPSLDVSQQPSPFLSPTSPTRLLSSLAGASKRLSISTDPLTLKQATYSNAPTAASAARTITILAQREKEPTTGRKRSKKKNSKLRSYTPPAHINTSRAASTAAAATRRGDKSSKVRHFSPPAHNG